MRDNPGRTLSYVVMLAVLLVFGTVVARGWVMPCVLHIGTCVP